MIISHKHKFIFLKTKKTAGTSLEIVLSRYTGEDDVLTLLGTEDAALRKRVGGRPAQNYWGARAAFSFSAWKSWISSLGYRARTGRCDRSLFPLEPYRQHMDAASVRAKVGKDVWESYYKFSVERNPWDRAVSNFHWKAFRIDRDMTFREFVLGGHALTLPRNFDIYSIRGIPQADRVLDYHNLNKELPSLFDELGLPGEAVDLMQTTRAKGQFRPDTGYRDYYDHDTQKVIGLQFAQEAEFMGYSF